MVSNTGFHLDEDDEPILNESGDPIPNEVCICFAHCASECVCGAWDIDPEEVYESGI